MPLLEKDAFKYCMICKGEFRNNSDIEKECPDCGYIYFIAPKPSAAALIFNEKGQLLLIKRNRNPHKGTWDIPAGFLDDKETIEQALEREMREEVGINLTNYKFYKSMVVNYEFKGIIKRSLCSVFLCNIDKGTIVQAGDDAESFKFVDLTDFDLNEIGFVEVRELISEFRNQQ